MSSNEAKALLKPLFDAYNKALEDRQVDKAAAYYHPDAVLVHKGKECKYGRPAIQQLLEEFDKMVGESTTKLSGDTYQMSTDYIIITSNYETTSEKSGVIKGKFLQIWKKENNTYLIYHDEFDMQ